MENNIPTVGEEGIWRGREMAWLRIDRYVDWKNDKAPVLFQPMLCQHCDSAPCEPVCPVYAAVHSEDGLNEQIYNRCVGTRYCSNNCPWKVRRFNWFQYDWPYPLNFQLNPDVTVRSRGVMEKCTFCVQRIRQARVVAKREGRPMRDGEVVPACVQTCPTGVYTFGDLMDESSDVSRIIRNDPRAYQVLHELNTKTAVIYLRRVVAR
jgi:molybdopterin-containing oxidoreductase family iron-sulfur binding subunit